MSGGGRPGLINFVTHNGATWITNAVLTPDGKFGIGTASPQWPLHLQGSGSNLLGLDQYSNDNVAPAIRSRKARGTSTTPLQVQDDDRIFGLYGTTYNDIGWSSNNTVAIQGRAVGAHTSTSQATAITFETTSPGAVARSERMRIDQNGNVSIGTTSPAATKLVVDPNGLTLSGKVIPAGWGGGIMAWDFYSPSGSFGVGDGSGSNTFGVGIKSVLNANGVFTSGTMGIGTMSPLRSMHIVSSGSAESILESSGVTAGTVGRIWRTRLDPATARFHVDAMTETLGSGSTILSLTPGGSVGIGTTNPGYKLDVQGGDINASGSVRAAGVALTSDFRYKRDIEPLDHALERILNLRGVSYNWRTEEFPQKHFSDRHQVGVIAQEVEQQFPEVVDTNKDGYKSVNYPALVAPLIEAVKTLYNRLIGVEAQQFHQAREIASKAEQSEVQMLKNKIKELEQQNTALQKYFCSKDPDASICK